MVWTAPLTFVDNTIPTASQMNTYVRNNLNETAPAKATTAGGHFVATGLNSIAQRVTLESTNNDNVSVTDTEWISPSGNVGPSVSPTCAGKALVFINCRIDAAVGHTAFAGYEIDSSSTLAPDESRAVNAGSYATRAGITDLVSGLSSGVHQFRMLYRVSDSTDPGEFKWRHIVVMPL